MYWSQTFVHNLVTSRVKSNINCTLKLKVTHFFVCAVQVWYNQCFCSGGRNVRPIEKSFAQRGKKIRGNIAHNTNESHDTGERKWLIGPNLEIFTQGCTHFCGQWFRHWWLCVELFWGDSKCTLLYKLYTLLYIVAKCHFFSVVTWKDIIKLQKCEGCTHFCEILYIGFRSFISTAQIVWDE